MTLAHLGRATGYRTKTNEWKQTLEQVQNYDTFTRMPLSASNEPSGLGAEAQQDHGQPAPPKHEGGVPQSLGRSGTPPTPRGARHTRNTTPHRHPAPAVEKQLAASWRTGAGEDGGSQAVQQRLDQLEANQRAILAGQAETLRRLDALGSAHQRSAH